MNQSISHNLACDYTSVWDGGYEITTSAVVEYPSGIVQPTTCSEDISGLVESLDREFVTVHGCDFDITDEDGNYVIEDKQAFVAHVKGVFA
ncbi:hypothetical protein FA132_34765 [Pseudomonas aeruginosa]|nr:hypothetical protein [Pseudomonas aeruginosa]